MISPLRATRWLVVAALAVLATVSSSARADVIWSDDDFANSDWSYEFSGSGGASHSTARNATGGNPGAYLHSVHVLPGFSSLGVYHFFQPATYNPSTSGAILSLDYHEDHIEIDPPFAGAAVGARPCLKQAGINYYGPDITYTVTTWTSVSLNGLTAADFTDGTNHPDFSATGGPIRFGYVRGNTNSGAGQVVILSGIDNWSVTLHGNITGVGDPGGPVRILSLAGRNPFRDGTTLRFSQPRGGHASVTIFDLGGRRVRTLLDAVVTPGSRDLTWDGRNDHGRAVPSGLYLVRADAAGEVANLRLIRID